jgi:hypothetical protein
MKHGTGLSLSLMWASGASAQRAVDDFCYERDRAATESGAALEYAAKMVVADLIGPRDVFTGRPALSEAELWVAGDHAARSSSPPPPDDVAAARASLLDRHSITPDAAVTKALKRIEPSHRPAIRSAATTVIRARNAAVHLGDFDVPLPELADAFVIALEAMWRLVPAAASGQWGVFREVAKVGVLGRRDTWERDKAIRLAQARERFYSMGTIFVQRSNQIAGRYETRCAVCNSGAFYDPASRQPSPSLVPRAPDDTVAVIDCLVCGLTLWGPQIGPPEHRIG